MNKNKNILAIIISVFIAIGVIISVILLNMCNREAFPKGPYFGKLTYDGNEHGLYYKDSNLMYYDKASGESIVFCNKPNCQHNTKDCNSYMGDHIGMIMLYGDYLYVCYFNINYIETEDWEPLEYEYNFGIVKVSLDGHRKEVIFEKTQPGAGGVTKMEGLDGKIYYTYYSMDPEEYMTQNYTMDNVYFACFDLKNGSNEIIQSWEGINADVDILETDSRDTIYLRFIYFTDENITLENLNKNRKIEFFSYSIGSGELNNCYTNVEIVENISKGLWISDSCMYCRTYTNEKIFYIQEDGTVKLAIDMINGNGRYYYPYLSVSKDDSDRILIDLDNKLLYVSKNINEKIPGILDYDYNSNTLYVDMSCYDNIPDGTVLTYNPVKVNVMDMETYLNKYFVLYTGDNYKGDMVLGEEWVDEVIVK